MNHPKLKETVRTRSKKGVFYVVNKENKRLKHKPWLGDAFSFLYDPLMKKTIFPKKINGSIDRHFQILEQVFQPVYQKKVIEFAAGSGNAVNFLPGDNEYTGVDISTGLLRMVKKKFGMHGVKDAELYVSDAVDTPFRDSYFDVAVCNLSINFFPGLDAFITELKRVLKDGAVFYCSIPLPEKKPQKVKINGTLYTAQELSMRFKKQGFRFEPLPYENGALLYFKAILLT